MEALQEKYADRDVAFFAVYVREPHPGETGFKQYRKHENYEHKKQYAHKLASVKNLTFPVLVDEMDETNHIKLGSLPNLVYIVNKEGKVEYKATWLDADSVDEVLAEIITTDDLSRPVKKTMDSSKVGTAI